jgi:U4/U6.U5 tri-snRNP component SNU23
MAERQGAYGTKSGDTDFRKKWDKAEYAERAKKRDQEEKERMQENEERMKTGNVVLRFYLIIAIIEVDCQGKRPRKHRREDVPKPTELMKQREAPLELDKNLGKTMVVQNPGGRGPGQPGFYCEPCNRTYKDSMGYLDHINGRARMYISCTMRIQIIRAHFRNRLANDRPNDTRRALNIRTSSSTNSSTSGEDKGINQREIF